MVLLHYFKDKRQFFVYDTEVVFDDLGYILQKHFPGKVGYVKGLSNPTCLEQQRIILQLFDFRICDGTMYEIHLAYFCTPH